MAKAEGGDYGCYEEAKARNTGEEADHAETGGNRVACDVPGLEL